SASASSASRQARVIANALCTGTTTSMTTSALMCFPQPPALCRSRQRPLQFRLQVCNILHADTQSHQVIGDSKLCPVLGRHGGVGHDGGVVDQAFDTTEGFGETEQLAAFQHAAGGVEATLDVDADDA